MSLLKNIYTPAFFEFSTSELKSLYPQFDEKVFLERVHIPEWANMELKQRYQHLTVSLKGLLADNYADEVQHLMAFSKHLRNKKEKVDSFPYLFLPDYVEKYGKGQEDLSLKAMEEITQFISCEFAIRPFIIQNQDKTMQQLNQWADHKSHHVRRLASEGCRPRLPWAMALPEFKREPAPIFPILEKLKSDETDYVRRSVANNLNDITKDHPQRVIDLVKKWKGSSAETDWIIKHACRNLLKQAEPQIMDMYGFAANPSVEIRDFQLQSDHLHIGEHLVFSFHIKNKEKRAIPIRLEYHILYKKANGEKRAKVFQILSRPFEAGEEVFVSRRQSFANMTTRTHYPGEHEIFVVLNGERREGRKFFLD